MATITLPVGSTSDDLQTVINGAISQDIIELTGDMAFLETVTVPEGLSITIQSAPGNTRTMSQTVTARHFFILGNLTLSNITIDGNVSEGQLTTIGGFEVSGSLYLLDGAIIQACCSSGDGGAVNLSGGTIGIRGGYIRNNFAVNGGGIYASDGSSINTSSGRISGNAAQFGGGVYLAGSTFNFSNGTIESNTAQSQGGGIYIGSNGALYMLSGTITGNRVTFDSGSGAGVSVTAGGYFEMSGGSITRNSLNLTGNQGGVGGGVCVRGGEFAMAAGTISYNQSIQYGAGVGVSSGGTFTMSGGFITYNVAETAGGGAKLSGGGIAIINGIVNMTGGTISHNEAAYGGGVYLGYGGNACRFIMTGGILEENYAAGYGGGVRAQYAAAYVGIGRSSGLNPHPIIRSNTTGYCGGGISVYASSVDLESGDIYGNTAVYGGGIFISDGGVCRIDDAAINSNEAELSGGGIFTDDYDYSDPASPSAYQNVITTLNTVFTGNRTVRAYVPPENAENFLNLGYQTTSIVDTSGYVHPLNNYDINYEGERMIILYRVTYDANGGTGGITSENLASGTEYTVLSSQAAGIERSGYSFTGWNTEPDGSGFYYEPGDTFVITDNVILYAQWTIEETYSVVYNANGGTGSYEDTDIPDGTSYTVLSPEAAGISRPGYSFAGWNTEPDGSGTYYEPGDPLVIMGDINLYAQWTPIEGPYDVIYDANGGMGSYGDTDIPRGAEYTVLSLEETGISRPGYTFSGWNTNRDGSGTAYQPGNTILITGNVALYAQWELIEEAVQIFYCPNCPCCCDSYNSCCCMVLGLSSITPYTIWSPQQLGICCPCHIFTGWNTQPDGSGTAYRPGDTAVSTEDITFYAQWVPCRRICCKTC